MIFNNYGYSPLSNESKHDPDKRTLMDRAWKVVSTMLLVAVCFSAGFAGFFVARSGSNVFARQIELGFLPCMMTKFDFLPTTDRILKY